MGKIGRCCCPDDDCVPCTEFASITNWTIATELFGFNLSGTFGSLVELTCKKFGYQCDRLDNILEDDLEISTDWGGWLNLYACLGECFDCSLPDEPIPPPPCTIDAITGVITCPPGTPTYTGVQYQVRNAFRFRFWWSKMVEVLVEMVYTSATTVRFFVYATYYAKSGYTSTSIWQRRWADTVFQCGSGNVVSRGTPSDPGELVPQVPLGPCDPLIGEPLTPDVDCVPPDPPIEPDPCETEEVETFNYDCQEVVGGVCVTNAYEIDLVVEETTRCCDDILCPPTDLITRVATYESIDYECDAVPSTIPLSLVGSLGDITVSWECENIDGEPAYVVYTIPTTIDLQVS